MGAQNSDQQASSARLLIVEDEILLAESTRYLLATFLQQIDLAHNGAAAVGLIEQNHYDLILLDLHLPDIHGLEILALARRKQPNCRVIIVSGDDDINSPIQALRLGAYDYLRKPCDPEHLVTNVRFALQRIMLERTLNVSFQPVVSLTDCSLFGHIGAAPGCLEEMVSANARLFASALQTDPLINFAERYFDAVMLGFTESDPGTILLLPIPALLIEAMGAAMGGLLEKALKKSGLKAGRLILLQPPISADPSGQSDKARAFADSAKRLGCGLGVSLLRSVPGRPPEAQSHWGRMVHDLVLLDENQFRGVDVDLTPLNDLAARVATESANRFGVLAQGIVALNELKAAKRIGANLACGDFIGKADAKPIALLPTQRLKALHAVCQDSSACSDSDYSSYFLNKLLVKTPTATPELSADAVFKLFEQDPNLHAIAVVKGETPLGLISRYEMVDNMARPYRHELYGRKSCTRFMDRDALSADVRMGLAELTNLVSSAPARHLISGFIITDRGRYLGMGSVQNLMREVTAMQFDAARYANPLTQLPGNVPINNMIDEHLHTKTPFAIAYCDLDNFKPLNDVFGYAMGDAMIILTARILTENADPELDFVGHIGGDDFLILFRSVDWKSRCERILERFDREIRSFFPKEIVQAGGYEAENRNGKREFMALTSLSIGASEIAPDAFQNHLAVAAFVTDAKKKAKATAGSCLYVNQRQMPETS